MMKKRKRGFTFFEIIVGTIVLLIGIASITSLVLWGRLVLKHSENKAQAMSIAYSKLEEYLANSYSGIGMQPTLGSTKNSSTPLAKGIEGTIFTESGEAASGNILWEAVVKQLYEGNEPDECPPGYCSDSDYETISIPYKEIDIQAKYREENPMQKGTFSDKAVRLMSFVPYPVLQALSPPALIASAGPPPPAEQVPANTYSRIGTGLKVDLDYETPKDILIIYNIAIKINDSTGLSDPAKPEAISTIYTGSFVDGASAPIPVVTRTPILSQPLISNVAALTGADYLTPGPHTIEVKWYKDVAGGNVSLRNANIIVIAVESKYAHDKS